MPITQHVVFFFISVSCGMIFWHCLPTTSKTIVTLLLIFRLKGFEKMARLPDMLSDNLEHIEVSPNLIRNYVVIFRKVDEDKDINPVLK